MAHKSERFSENARNTGSDRGRNIAVHEVSTKNKYVMEKKIGIASDHAGYEMKEFLVGYLAAKGWDVLDFGPESEESVDYPDFAQPAGQLPSKAGSWSAA